MERVWNRARYFAAFPSLGESAHFHMGLTPPLAILYYRFAGLSIVFIVNIQKFSIRRRADGEFHGTQDFQVANSYQDLPVSAAAPQVGTRPVRSPQELYQNT